MQQIVVYSQRTLILSLRPIQILVSRFRCTFPVVLTLYRRREGGFRPAVQGSVLSQRFGRTESCVCMTGVHLECMQPGIRPL